MKAKKRFRDRRVKRKIFPISIFIATFFAFGLFTTLQMQIIGDEVDYQSVSASCQAAVVMLWCLAALVFTLWINYHITLRYQKPIEEFSEAAGRVASGDFSVYVAPRHEADKATHLDILFSDFNKMVEELGSIETLKTDFFSNVSHEIKTPLALIQSNAELLHRDGLTQEQREEYTEVILHATKRLSSLVTNMLKLNKLEKQAIQPQPQEYDLCGQVLECALQFEEQLEKKNIDFSADMEDRTVIRADAGLLELVWTNLMSNAVKFTPEGGCITISQFSQGEKVVVSFSDTGCGMDEGTIQRIFDRFYQGDTSHSTEGNGLGLALVERILRLSDGSISVKSAVGKGSVFTVKLPVSQAVYGEE